MSLDQANKSFFEDCRKRVYFALEKYLPSQNLAPKNLHKAMHYAALGSGKRIRPILVYSAGKALGVELNILDNPACAVELIHAYSLVHDDLPAMDNDDLRRGKPTCHKKFDEATAILVGDALQSLAFSVLSDESYLSKSPQLKIKIVNELSSASGSDGMAGGQALDVEAVGSKIGIKELENIHSHKTGALIKASVKMGAMCADNVAIDDFSSLEQYATCIGLAFQVRDDILDVQGNAETLGKTGGKDAASDKPTYPSILGMQGAHSLSKTLLDKALQSLSNFDNQADPLRSIAKYVIERQK